MTTVTDDLKPGDRATWMRAQRGGYGYVVPVPCTIEQVPEGGGRVLVHAAKGMTRDEFDSAAIFSYGRTGSARLVPPHELQRGGIVGSVEIVDCVTQSASRWFMGRFGFVLRDPQPLAFMPWRGQLGFFDVPDDALSNAEVSGRAGAAGEGRA